MVTADVSVRVAMATDAAAIARVQVAAWRQMYADLMPAPLLDGLSADELTGVWESSLHRPGDARNRVLVALAGPHVVGFAVTGPTSDPDRSPLSDGEIAEFLVAPTATGAGHGSRLLQAAVDTLRADRFSHAVWWLRADDDTLRGFLTSAGWAPDTAHRELELAAEGTSYPAVRVRQVRLHTAL